MSHIYIAFVDTPGIFASIIRNVLKQRYIHVAIGMDERMEEAYSIGRRNPAIPFFAGFVKEYIKEILHRDFQNRYQYHYTIVGLPLILFQLPFKQKYYHTCSSYLAKLLEDAGICKWKKHTSIVTPKDFYKDLEKEVIFEGPLYYLVNQKEKIHRTEYSPLW